MHIFFNRIIFLGLMSYSMIISLINGMEEDFIQENLIDIPINDSESDTEINKELSIISLRLRPYGTAIRTILNYVIALINLQGLTHSENYISKYVDNIKNDHFKNKSLIFYNDLYEKMNQFCNNIKDLKLEKIYANWVEPIYTFKNLYDHSYQDCTLIFIFNKKVDTQYSRNNFNNFFKNQFEKKEIYIQPIELTIKKLENSNNQKIFHSVDENLLNRYKNILTQKEDDPCRIL